MIKVTHEQIGVFWKCSHNTRAQFSGYAVSEFEDKTSKEQPAILNPVYWVIAVIILLLFKWDEISAWFW